MNAHATLQYLAYKWKAKGRHGVHSPFVYDLIGHVLLDKGPIPKASVIKCPEIPLSYENLVSRITTYYNCKEILLPSESGHTVHSSIDLLLLNGAKPAEWVTLYTKHSGLLENDSIVIITDIHKTADHTKAWKRLCSDEQVRMSVDMYGIGMLLFKTEFKEKQHFILKY